MKKLKDFVKLFSPFDWSTLGYMLISGVYMLAGYNKVDALGWHFLYRLLVGLLICLLVYLDKNIDTPSVKKNIALARTIYAYFILNFFYSETSYIKNIVFNQDLDNYVASIEQHLWGMQPSIEFPAYLNIPWFKELMYFAYFSFYLMIPVVGLSIYFKHKEKASKPLFMIVFSFYLFYIVYDVFPVLGPQYYYHTYGNEGEPAYLFGKIMRYLQQNVERPTGAFPSSHAGMGLALCYIAYKHHRKIFWYVLPFLIGICFATVYLKEHYLVDVLAGLFIAPVFMYISGNVYPKILLLSEKIKETDSSKESESPNEDEEISPVIIK